MMPGDWTTELARQRMAELRRRAEHQRLVRLARAQRRGGAGGVGRRRRWLAGWLQGSDESLMEPRLHHERSSVAAKLRSREGS